jgi:hypothetical protein
MTQFSYSPDIEPVYQLLTNYSFDTEDYAMDAVIGDWLEECGPVWVSHAITEALYQGRYKVVSIDHILKLWQRRGQPIRHFNREFESIILGQALLCPTGYGDGSETCNSRTVPAPAVQTIDQAPDAPGADGATSDSQAKAPQIEDLQVEDLQVEDGQVEDGQVEDGQVEDSQAMGSDGDAEDAEAIAPPGDRDRPTGVIPNFRPLVPDLAPTWPQAEEIQPFVPRQDSSELHQRLRAVVKGGMRD